MDGRSRNIEVGLDICVDQLLRLQLWARAVLFHGPRITHLSNALKTFKMTHRRSKGRDKENWKQIKKFIIEGGSKKAV